MSTAARAACQFQLEQSSSEPDRGLDGLHDALVQLANKAFWDRDLRADWGRIPKESRREQTLDKVVDKAWLARLDALMATW
jgi:hypothetical protein